MLAACTNNLSYYTDYGSNLKGMFMQDAIPTDSVLRRHYETSHSKTSQNKPPQNSSGFMDWLKRLFGG